MASNDHCSSWGREIMARGRKRKSGARTKSGQLSRAKIDTGNDVVSKKSALYGTNHSDAIGRAFANGLLGDDNAAKAMLDTARSISRTYWQSYETGPIRCTLGDRAGGASIAEEIMRQHDKERWLTRTLKSIDNNYRSVFDGLVVDINPDSGPPWLDNIIRELRTREASNSFKADSNDWAKLAGAIETLADIANVRMPQLKRA